jgi:hypothetical protein
MQGIYTYIPETNNVPREFIVAAILLLLFMGLSLVPALSPLCFYVSSFRSMCALPNMAVFSSSLRGFLELLLLLLLLLHTRPRAQIHKSTYERHEVSILHAGISLLYERKH